MFAADVDGRVVPGRRRGVRTRLMDWEQLTCSQGEPEYEGDSILQPIIDRNAQYCENWTSVCISSGLSLIWSKGSHHVDMGIIVGDNMTLHKGRNYNGQNQVEYRITFIDDWKFLYNSHIKQIIFLIFIIIILFNWLGRQFHINTYLYIRHEMSQNRINIIKLLYTIYIVPKSCLYSNNAKFFNKFFFFGFALEYSSRQIFVWWIQKK